MADFGETVLLERSGVRVTPERFTILDTGVNYDLSTLVSAEIGHETPGFADWPGWLILVGLGIPLMSLCGVVQALIGMPGSPDPEDQAVSPALYWPSRPSITWDWNILFVGLGIAAVGAVLYALLHWIYSRCIVRAETRSNECMTLFRSRDAALVRDIVQAIDRAIAARARLPAPPASAR